MVLTALHIGTPGGIVKPRFLGPITGDSGVHLRIYISHKFPGDADMIGAGTTRGVAPARPG